MTQLTAHKELREKIFKLTENDFEKTALAVFQFQFDNNKLYREFCNSLNIEKDIVTRLSQVPFLPIQFFKSKKILSIDSEPTLVFESSGTMGNTSRHFVYDPSLYRTSFLKTFEHFYGSIKNYCVLALLPSYLEKGNSSLVWMVNEFIKESKHANSDFYLYDHDRLNETLRENEKKEQPVLLIGVTYALLDFFEMFPQQLQHTIIMETGGMKGRREELPREEVHRSLMQHSGTSAIHSEYGMTELLSQAYSKGKGIFNSPAWMKILVRDEDDPFQVHIAAKNKSFVQGAINIIDLANLYSCSFIATDDVGKLYADGSFEISGRLDNSDIRGCSLMLL